MHIWIVLNEVPNKCLFQENLDSLKTRTLGNEHEFVSCMTDMCSSSYSGDKIDTMHKLREQSKVKGYDTTFSQTEECIRVRADRIDSLKNDLKSFFEQLWIEVLPLRFASITF